jgi:hypothetical protein
LRNAHPPNGLETLDEDVFERALLVQGLLIPAALILRALRGSLAGAGQFG